MNQSDLIYFDHAGATPLDKRVLEAMMPYFEDQFFNPSSPYAPAVQVRRNYEDARHRLAVAIGGKADEIILTAGATESIALAMTAIGRGEALVSSIEHEAVLENAKSLPHRLIEVDKFGRVDPRTVADNITDKTTLISIALANSELGVIQPIHDISLIVQKERQRRLANGNHTPIWLHTDASQGVGQLDVSLSRLGVDMMTLNAGKIYGPKQVGLLWRRGEINLSPIILGGGQELGLRSGTENVAGVIGFALALELATIHRKSEALRLAKLRDNMKTRLVNEFPEMTVNGNPKKQLAGHLHISFPGIDAERLIFLLESKGVMVATGSACSANKQTGSSVLKAIGMPEELRSGSLRISLGRLNGEENTARGAELIAEAVKNEYARLRR